VVDDEGAGSSNEAQAKTTTQQLEAMRADIEDTKRTGQLSSFFKFDRKIITTSSQIQACYRKWQANSESTPAEDLVAT